MRPLVIRNSTKAFPHEHVDHKAHEYVRGEVHTNNLESFWSLLKRGVIGTYHNVSRTYLPLYLAEFQFRHNNRNKSRYFQGNPSRMLRSPHWQRPQPSHEPVQLRFPWS
jgi:hypothetical protein